MSIQKLALAFAIVAFSVSFAVAQSGTVKVTPLGSRTGDFCAQDRALLFEDPTGVRILFDPGDTVAGGQDSRLGAVDAILVTHAHSVHIGNIKLAQDPNSPQALCVLGPGFGSDVTPFSNVAMIAAAKNSAVIAGSTLSTFFALRIAQLRGTTATPACAATGLNNELIVPTAVPCTGLINPGGNRTLRRASASRGVVVSAVPAVHPSELQTPAFLTDPEKSNLAANAVSNYVGIANGFVVTFTNGLTVYLSGDTGLTTDMETVVNRFFHANLTVINISNLFVTGPEQAAFAVKNLIRSRTVIPSHANEIATTGGVVNPGTRTAQFIELLQRRDSNENSDAGDRFTPSVFVPLSGVTREFDGQARCQAGCN